PINLAEGDRVALCRIAGLILSHVGNTEDPSDPLTASGDLVHRANIELASFVSGGPIRRIQSGQDGIGTALDNVSESDLNLPRADHSFGIPRFSRNDIFRIASARNRHVAEFIELGPRGTT